MFKFNPGFSLNLSKFKVNVDKDKFIQFHRHHWYKTQNKDNKKPSHWSRKYRLCIRKNKPYNFMIFFVKFWGHKKSKRCNWKSSKKKKVWGTKIKLYSKKVKCNVRKIWPTYSWTKSVHQAVQWNKKKINYRKINANRLHHRHRKELVK